MTPGDFDLPWLRGGAEANARFARELAALCAAGSASADAFRRFGAEQFTAGVGPSSGGPGSAHAAASAAAQAAASAEAFASALAAAFGANAATFAGATEAPPLGPAREHQLRWRVWTRAAQDYLAAAQAFATVLGEIGAAAGERYASRLAEPDATSAPLRVLFDDWIECAEAAYQQAAHGERFCAAQARFTNAMVAWRRAQQSLAEEASQAFDVPTRSEVDELQRVVRELQRELAATKSEAGTPRPAATDAEPPAANAKSSGAEATRAATKATRATTTATRPATKPKRPATTPTRDAAAAQRPATKAQRPATKAQRPATKAKRPATEAQRPAAKTQRPAPKAAQRGARPTRRTLR